MNFDKGASTKVPVSHVGKVSQSDPRTTLVHLPEGLRDALSDLASAVESSKHFDKDTASMMREWAAGRSLDLEGFVVGLHGIAAELLKHVGATGDGKVRAAWEEIGGQLVEQGFTITKRRVRGG